MKHQTDYFNRQRMVKKNCGRKSGQAMAGPAGPPTTALNRAFFFKIDPGVSVLADPEIWHFPLTLLVVLTTLSHYRVRCNMTKY